MVLLLIAVRLEWHSLHLRLGERMQYVREQLRKAIRSRNGKQSYIRHTLCVCIIFGYLDCGCQSLFSFVCEFCSALHREGCCESPKVRSHRVYIVSWWIPQSVGELSVVFSIMEEYSRPLP